MPRMDVVEDSDRYEILAEVPGLEKEQMEVLYEDGQVIIRGEKKRPEEPDRVRRAERPYGKFERRFVLSHEIDAGEAKAQIQDGVLRVVMPKVAPPEPGQIDLN